VVIRFPFPWKKSAYVHSKIWIYHDLSRRKIQRWHLPMNTPVIRVFPRKTSFTPVDDFSFVGDPPLFRPHADEVHVSVTFTWDKVEGKRLQEAWSQYYPVVKLGGPAFGDIANRFVPGMYVKPGVTFTTRGCNNRCPWCLVPGREGKLFEISDFSPGYIVQDNNLLQASRKHIKNVLSMLSHQPRAAVFSGGLQSSLVDDWFVRQLLTMRIGCVFLSADTENSLQPLEKALQRLSFLPFRKLRVYVMIGMETIEAAKQRLEKVWQLGGLPFAQLYQPEDGEFIHYSQDWLDLARTWSRPAAMFTLMRSFGK
jgi:hypothetical protein